MANERKSESVPLLGIDTSSPDMTVKDGSCEMIWNMRYAAGGWRNVAPFRRILELTDSGAYDILYKHPASDTYRFIASRGSLLYEVEAVKNTDGTYTLQVTQELLDIPNTTAYDINHFGNVLIVRAGSPQKKIYYFSWSSGVYTEFITPEVPVLSITGNDSKAMNLSYYKTNADQYFDPTIITPPNPQVIRDSYHRILNLTTGASASSVNDGNSTFWVGEIALFAVFRMKDGTILSPSRIQILDSTTGGASRINGAYVAKQVFGSDTSVFFEIRVQQPLDGIANIYDIKPGSNYSGIKPVINIEINKSSINTKLIDRVSIYSTRVQNPFDLESITAGSLSDYVDQLRSGTADRVIVPMNEVWGDNTKLLKEPFYIMKDIDIKDFDSNGKYSLEVDYTLLNGLEHKSVYEPNQNLHSIFPEVLFDYNGRLHMGNMKTDFFKGYPLSEIIHTAGYARNYYGVVVLPTGKGDKYIRSDFNGTARSNYTSDRSKNLRVLVYPDYRAEELRVYFEQLPSEGDGYLCVDQRTLTASESNNISFYVMPPYWVLGSGRKYSFLDDFISPGEDPVASVPNDSQLIEGNRLQVSGLNNLFSLPFNLSYSVGNPEESIVAFNSIADELSDAKFGEFPLYVFTTAGIWAMQQGSGEVLYGSIVPINHDRISNPNTVAAQYNVFYITARGLFALQGRAAKLLSEPLNNIRNEVDNSFLDGASLYYQHRYNEIIAYNPDTGQALVYSVDGGYWSARDMGGWKLNNDLFVLYSNRGICDFENEENKNGVSWTFYTRPIKLGSHEFKRIETFIARITSGTPADEINITIEGSNDLEKWFNLRNESIPLTRDVTLRRTPLSCKYFRVTIGSTTASSITLTGMDIEYYLKYLHRKR